MSPPNSVSFAASVCESWRTMTLAYTRQRSRDPPAADTNYCAAFLSCLLFITYVYDQGSNISTENKHVK